MEYGKLIKRAFQVTWRHKILWVFGFLAALFGGQANGRFGNNLSYTFNQTGATNWQDWWQQFLQRGDWSGRGMPDWLTSRMQTLPGILVAGLVVIIIIAVVVCILGILVRYTSLGALIGSVDEIEQAHAISFKGGFRRGWGRLLRLFGIDLLLGLAGLAGAIVVLLATAVGALVAAGPLLLTGTYRGWLTAIAVVWAVIAGLVVVLFFIACVVALGGLMTVLREYAFRACVLGLQGVGASIRAAIALLKARFHESLVTWLILAGINLALGILAIPLSLLGVGGVLVPTLAIRGLTESTPAALAAIVPFALVAVLVALVIGGLYLVFQSSVWTLAYREINKPTAAVE